MEKQRKLVEVIVDIEEEFERVRLTREQLKKEEYVQEKETEKAHTLMVECQDALDKVVPCLNEAINSMQ